MDDAKDRARVHGTVGSVLISLALVTTERHGDKVAQSWSHTSSPAAVEKAGPRIMRLGEMVLPLTVYSTLKSRLCTLPGRHSGAETGGGDTGEPALRVRANPAPSHSMWWHGQGKDVPPATCYLQQVGEVVGELSLFYTRCSTSEIRPHTLPGQHSRAGPGGVSASDPDPRVGEQENWPCSLLPAVWGDLAGAVLELTQVG